MARKEKLSALQFKIWLKAPPSKVWRAVTSGKDLGRWFTKPKKLELKKGGRWDFAGFPGVALEVVKGKKFSHTHCFQKSFSRMTYQLERAGKHTQLTVTHDRFGKDKFTRGCWEGAWPFILCNLKSHIETGSPMWETAFSGKDE